jgi:hypothetical protein
LFLFWRKATTLRKTADHRGKLDQQGVARCSRVCRRILEILRARHRFAGLLAARTIGRCAVNRAMCATSHSEASQERVRTRCDQVARESSVSSLQHAGPRTVKATSPAQLQAYLTGACVKPLPANGSTGFPPSGNAAVLSDEKPPPTHCPCLKSESSRVANSP